MDTKQDCRGQEQGNVKDKKHEKGLAGVILDFPRIIKEITTFVEGLHKPDYH